VEAQPGQSQNAIIKDTLLQLTNPPFKFMDPIKSAPKVLFWYRFFTLGRSPIIVINATERKVGEEYASLTGAVRTLVDKYKLRVVVDGSPNSLDETLLRSTRETIIDIKPMTQEMIWRIEQLQDLFKYVKEADLDDTVFALLGGIPSTYEKLWRNSKTDLQDGKPPREVIGSHLSAEISTAIKLVEAFCGNEDTAVANLMKLFKETSVFRESTLISKHIKRLTPDKVFREVEQDGVFVLIPASNAIRIVLQHHLTKKPTLNELAELIKT